MRGLLGMVARRLGRLRRSLLRRLHRSMLRRADGSLLRTLRRDIPGLGWMGRGLNRRARRWLRGRGAGRLLGRLDGRLRLGAVVTLALLDGLALVAVTVVVLVAVFGRAGLVLAVAILADVLLAALVTVALLRLALIAVADYLLLVAVVALAFVVPAGVTLADDDLAAVVAAALVRLALSVGAEEAAVAVSAVAWLVVGTVVSVADERVVAVLAGARRGRGRGRGRGVMAFAARARGGNGSFGTVGCGDGCEERRDSTAVAWLDSRWAGGDSVGVSGRVCRRDSGGRNSHPDAGGVRSRSCDCNLGPSMNGNSRRNDPGRTRNDGGVPPCRSCSMSRQNIGLSQDGWSQKGNSECRTHVETSDDLSKE